jgi:hypothetical protein
LNKPTFIQEVVIRSLTTESQLNDCIDYAERIWQTLSERGYGDKRGKAGNGSRFAPPSLPEVKAYCKERGNNVDPVQFISHYESNGWKVGRNGMKCWKSAIHTWEKREDDKPEKQSEEFKIPRDNEQMVRWAEKWGYPKPSPGESYPHTARD